MKKLFENWRLFAEAGPPPLPPEARIDPETGRPFEPRVNFDPPDPPAPGPRAPERRTGAEVRGPRHMGQDIFDVLAEGEPVRVTPEIKNSLPDELKTRVKLGDKIQWADGHLSTQGRTPPRIKVIKPNGSYTIYNPDLSIHRQVGGGPSAYPRQGDPEIRHPRPVEPRSQTDPTRRRVDMNDEEIKKLVRQEVERIKGAPEGEDPRKNRRRGKRARKSFIRRGMRWLAILYALYELQETLKVAAIIYNGASEIIEIFTSGQDLPRMPDDPLSEIDAWWKDLTGFELKLLSLGLAITIVSAQAGADMAQSASPMPPVTQMGLVPGGADIVSVLSSMTNMPLESWMRIGTVKQEQLDQLHNDFKRMAKERGKVLRSGTTDPDPDSYMEPDAWSDSDEADFGPVPDEDSEDLGLRENFKRTKKFNIIIS